MPRKQASWLREDVISRSFSRTPDTVPEHLYKQLQKYCLTDRTEREVQLFGELNLKNGYTWFHCQTARMQLKGLELDLIKVQHNSLLLIFHLLYRSITFLNLNKTSNWKGQQAYWRAELGFQKFLTNLKGE